MNVITLRDYAKQNNISYEAVRKQVVRYQEDLAGHLIKDGRQQFLDEEAVAFLDTRRQKNPVAIIQIEKDEKIEQLQHENKQLLLKLAAVQEALLVEKDKTDALLAEKKAEIALLEADNEDQRAKTLEAEETALKASGELQRVKKIFMEDLRKKDEQVEAWEKYERDMQRFLADDAAYRRRLFKNKKNKPVPPVAPNYQEKENEEK